MSSEARDASRLLPGLVAVALFGVLALVFLGAEFPTMSGFPNNSNITASIGYAMFNIKSVGGQQIVAGEGFLIAFEIIDLVLVAALVAAVMLARRDSEMGVTTVLRADGGKRGGDDE